MIGGTGLIGSYLTDILKVSEQWKDIQFISRKDPELPEKFTVLNISEYTMLSNIDVAFCTLGTTMANAGSKDAFLKVDHDMVLDFARKAKQAGAKVFLFVSSVGADSKSSNFYLRVKGEVENNLRSMGFESLVILRPSLLLGPRKNPRTGETIGKKLMCVIDPLMFGPFTRYRGINAATVAAVMVKQAISKPIGVSILEYQEIQDINAR